MLKGSEVKDGAVCFLLRRPNEIMSMQEMQRKLLTSLKINGNLFIHKRYQGKKLTGLIPLLPTAVEAKKDREQNIYLKFYWGNGTTSTLPYSELIHVRDDFYTDDFFGESPAEVLKDVMECITITDQGIRHAVKNNFLIKWIAKFNNSIRPEDLEKQVKKVSEALSNEENGGVAGVDAKFDLVQVKNGNRIYMPENSTQKQFVERVWNLIGVNEAIVTNKFTEDEFASWFASEMEPLAMLLTNAFTDGIFTKREQAEENEILFDSSDLVFASNKTKMQLVQLLDRGVLSIEKYQEILNLGDMDGQTFIIRREYGSTEDVLDGVETTTKGGDKDERNVRGQERK